MTKSLRYTATVSTNAAISGKFTVPDDVVSFNLTYQGVYDSSTQTLDTTALTGVEVTYEGTTVTAATLAAGGNITFTTNTTVTEFWDNVEVPSGAAYLTLPTHLITLKADNLTTLGVDDVDNTAATVNSVAVTTTDFVASVANNIASFKFVLCDTAGTVGVPSLFSVEQRTLNELVTTRNAKGNAFLCTTAEQAILDAYDEEVEERQEAIEEAEEEQAQREIEAAETAAEREAEYYQAFVAARAAAVGSGTDRYNPGTVPPYTYGYSTTDRSRNI